MFTKFTDQNGEEQTHEPVFCSIPDCDKEARYFLLDDEPETQYLCEEHFPEHDEWGGYSCHPYCPECNDVPLVY